MLSRLVEQPPDFDWGDGLVSWQLGPDRFSMRLSTFVRAVEKANVLVAAINDEQSTVVRLPRKRRPAH